ncbi:hypothetical protein B296_00012353 [Ensete ventricosum]|uniref:Uncharacterized protein n=1 Tax=Ensete ventricosum TaxID=4639 RepID=A0A427A380_ENSVE|nr:hypothetical protein B296_00012353 [Ensete ventricosum]
MSKGDDAAGVEFRDVWADNLEAELAVIREVVDDFPFVAMDTEFPGVAIRPLGDFKTVAYSNYHVLRANVDLIQPRPHLLRRRRKPPGLRQRRPPRRVAVQLQGVRR